MSRSSRRDWLGMFGGLLTVGLLATNAPAELLRITTGQSRCCVTCPSCSHRCEFKIERTTEEKECFEVECETICIPRIRFPWTRCNEPYQATQRTVQKLKTRTYECPACEYTWRAVECAPCAPAEPAPQEAAPAEQPPVPQPADANAASFQYYSPNSSR